MSHRYFIFTVFLVIGQIPVVRAWAPRAQIALGLIIRNIMPEIEIGVPPPNGPFFTNFTGSAGYDSGFNGGAPLGVQYDPWRLEEEYGTRW
jgi:hypothetical protein